MARKKIEEAKKEGAPLWMVTYGDMMTLLVVFFVLIIAYSTTEIIKFTTAMGSFQGAIQPWKQNPSGDSMIKSIQINYMEQYKIEAIEEIEELVQKAGMVDEIEIHDAEEGIKLIMQDPVLFEEGKADLRRQIFPVMRGIIKIAIDITAKEIKIEGHTDDTPINTEKFPSNWELSVARALQVLKFFQAEGYPPEKLVAVGYSQYRPRKILPLDATSEVKGINRRVEIFLKMTDNIGVGL